MRKGDRVQLHGVVQNVGTTTAGVIINGTSGHAIGVDLEHVHLVQPHFDVGDVVIERGVPSTHYDVVGTHEGYVWCKLSPDSVDRQPRNGPYTFLASDLDLFVVEYVTA